MLCLLRNCSFTWKDIISLDASLQDSNHIYHSKDLTMLACIIFKFRDKSVFFSNMEIQEV